MSDTRYIVEELLPSIGRSRYRYDNVPRGDGMFLRWLVEATCRRRALEMGTANGYSAICLGLGLEKNGGHLVTVEKCSRKSDLCRLNLQKAGLEKTVVCLTGNALNITPDLPVGFDFLFPDLPVDVRPFVQAAMPKMSPGYVIALHNLGFARKYRKILEFAQQNRLCVNKVNITGGYGFFVISDGEPGVDFSLFPEAAADTTACS
ncbi:MAG: O-methyltransferase [Thermodesulfobacteriota bacterium]